MKEKLKKKSITTDFWKPKRVWKNIYNNMFIKYINTMQMKIEKLH